MTPIFAAGNDRTLRRLKSLRQKAYADGASRVVTRLEAIMQSLQGRTSGQIAQLLQADRTRVHAWIHAWNRAGAEGLWEGHRSGRPSELNAADRERLSDLVESGPVAYGLNTAVWTSPLLAQIIWEEFEVDYHPGHVRRLLGKMGFSVQRPTTRLVQADPVKRRRWIRYQFPSLKKKPGPSKP
jgi:transposase